MGVWPSYFSWLFHGAKICNAKSFEHQYVCRGRLHTLAGFNKPKNQDPRKNMGAAAHLIRGSSDGRFSITCAVKEVSQQEIENVMDGKDIYYVPNPHAWAVDQPREI